MEKHWLNQEQTGNEMMMKNILWILTVFGMVFQVAAENMPLINLKYLPEKIDTSDTPALKSIKAIKLSSPPPMDGRLDDAVWQNAGEINSFIVLNSAGKTPACVKTQAKFVYTQDDLYIGVRCEEPDMNGLKVKCREYGGPVWADDCVEFWIDPRESGNSAYHIVFNSIGTVSEVIESEEATGKIKCEQRTWRSGAVVKTFKGDNFWSAEVQIPFKNIDIANPDFISRTRFNMARERRSSGEIELSSWTGNFASPIKKFGVIELNAPLIEAELLGWSAFYGANQLTLKVKNNAKDSSNIKVKITAEPSSSGNIEKEIVLKSAGEEVLQIPYSFDKYGILYNLNLAIFSGSMEVLSRGMTGIIASPLDLKLDGNQFYIGKDKKLHGLISIRQEKTYLQKLNLFVRLLDQDKKVISESKITDIKNQEIELNCNLDKLTDETTYKIEVLLNEKDKELFRKDADFEMLSPPF